MECTITRLLKDGDRIAGAFGYWRESGRFVVFEAPAVVLATGGIGKAYKVTSNSWEYTGDGHALALWAGADLIDMEFVQFHPTGMVWPPSVRGILVTEGVRGDGGVLRNADGERFMFRYIPEMFRAETADTEEEADRWYTDKKRPPHARTCCLATRWPGPSTPRSRRAGAVPTAGCSSTSPAAATPTTSSAACRRCTTSSCELADVDITKEPMEVGPTCHYMMGGVRVDAETQASTVPGLFAAGEVAAGLHGANRLGGNSLSDLLVFGRRAGRTRPSTRPASPPGRPSTTARARRAAPARRCARSRPPAPRTRTPSSSDLQECMQDAGRDHPHRGRARQGARGAGRPARTGRRRVRVEGHRQYNPGWHLALDLDPLLAVSECITRAALERRESRGGAHPRRLPRHRPGAGQRQHRRPAARRRGDR